MWLLALPGVILVVVYSIVYGSKSRGSGRFIWHYISRYGGYLVPIGYIGLMGYFFYEFHRYCLPLLQSATHRRWIPLNYPIPIVTIIWGVLSDPGLITRSNHAKVMSVYPYDRILFMPMNECRTCHFEKPARSRHCSTCNGCIALADHHCLFLNRCIGAKNYKQFMAFLFTTLYIFIYGGIVTSSILLRLIPDLLEQGHRGRDLFRSILRVGRGYRAAACMLILCVLLGIINVVFIAAQVKYIYVGATTNEVTKWEDVNELMDEGKLYMYELPAETKQSIVLQRLSDGTWHRSLNSQEQQLVSKYKAPLVQITSHESVHNIYDEGFRRNLKTRLCPPNWK